MNVMYRFLLRYRPALVFGAKMVACYVLWDVAYRQGLGPDGRLDAWLSAHVVQASGGVLRLLGYPVFAEGRIVGIEGMPGLLIVDGCNGLAPIGLFAGFVLAYPGRMLRRVSFLPAGMLVVCLCNVARVVLLALLQRHWEAGFDFVHDLGASAIFYGVIFVLWVVWANYGTPGPQRVRMRVAV